MRAKRRRPNLTGKKATVAIHRNGLSIEIAEIPAVDAGLVAAELLQVLRDLTKPYPELIQDAGSLGAGAGIEVGEDDEGPDGTDAPHAKRTVGFTRE